MTMTESKQLRQRESAPLPAMSFGEMMQMGDALVKTGFLPVHLKNGAQVAAIVLTGRELGMEPMRAIRSLNLVKGKVTENADSQLARFKADGGRAQFRELTDERAVLYLRHPNGDEHEEVFSLLDARNAGIASDMYKKYPKAMLRSRAITAGLKSIGWDGAVGNYDPDELDGTPLQMPGDDRPALAAVHALSAGDSQPICTLDEAMEMRAGRTRQRLGDMSEEHLRSLESWAEEKGNARLAYAARLVIDQRGPTHEEYDDEDRVADDPRVALDEAA